ncbi:26035_t:CDS:2, partial [Racocetra persica]
IPQNYHEPFLNLINAQPELKEIELKYFKIKFDKDNIANIMPNLEVLSIKQSYGNPFGEVNNLQNLQRLELIDNDIELNRTMLKSKCISLKFLKIIEKELSNEVKEEIVFLLSLNYPNIMSLCYVTDNLI